MKNKTKIPALYRQGDVAIRRIESLPGNLKKSDQENGRVILAHGEITGHAHAFAGPEVDKFTSAEGAEFFHVRGRTIPRIELPLVRRWKNQVMVQHPVHGLIEFSIHDIELRDDVAVVEGDFGLLRHDEHSTQGIPAGLYEGAGAGRSVRQREYHPQEVRRVAD